MMEMEDKLLAPAGLGSGRTAWWLRDKHARKAGRSKHRGAPGCATPKAMGECMAAWLRCPGRRAENRPTSPHPTASRSSTTSGASVMRSLRSTRWQRLAQRPPGGRGFTPREADDGDAGHLGRVGVDGCNPRSGKQDGARQGQAKARWPMKQAHESHAAGAQFIARTAPVAGAGAGGNGQRQRHHVHQGGDVGCDLVCARCCRAHACHIQRHQGERGDLYQIDKLAGTPSCANWLSVGQCGRSSLRQICAGAYVGCVRSSHQPTPQRKKLTAKVAQAQPTTPMGAKPQPPNVNQMDSGSLTAKDPHLQHEQLAAPERLAQRAEQTKQQGGRQAPAHNRQIVLHQRLQIGGHLGPAQHGRRAQARLGRRPQSARVAAAIVQHRSSDAHQQNPAQHRAGCGQDQAAPDLWAVALGAPEGQRTPGQGGEQGCDE
ncbi:hypothetical protein FQA39_LY18680 [Lamprigera yunnana]|nr:hypothetical protein FQA39_LY18680 [Lamprigera yunnana]